MSRRIAVVLFNLGGPDGPAAVKPFLFNLFNDPAIIGAPDFIRTRLARFISTRREKSAQANYAVMGGASPLLPETRKQADALEAALAAALPNDAVRCFIAMRYWHPMTAETAKAVEAFAPDEIVLLPLYPQFSTTTTASSLKAWGETYRGPGRARAVCCYPEADGFLDGYAALVDQAWEAAGRRLGVVGEQARQVEQARHPGDHRDDVQAPQQVVMANKPVAHAALSVLGHFDQPRHP
jgi:ferrochelatase